MSSRTHASPDNRPGEQIESRDPVGRLARARNGLRVPGALLRLVLYDPAHVAERLTVYEIDRQAAAAAAWAREVRATRGASVADIADSQRRRTISSARVDGAVAGTPFFIALVPAYIAFLRQEVRFHLRMASLYGHDPASPTVAADFLVLRGVHKDSETAIAELTAVRAHPLPARRQHTPLRAWYSAVVSVLILAGFMAARDEDARMDLTGRERALRVIRFIVAGGIWLLTWVIPVTFMIVMSWGCESDARRFGQRVTGHYRNEDVDIGVVIARADRRAGGNKAITAVRGALVVLSIALPLALIASTVLGGKGPLGVDLPQAAGVLAALALVIGVSVAAIRG